MIMGLIIIIIIVTLYTFIFIIKYTSWFVPASAESHLIKIMNTFSSSLEAKQIVTKANGSYSVVFEINTFSYT